MVSVLEQVQHDVKSALKAGEKERVHALRLIANELQRAAKENGGDDVEVLQRERKRRLEAAEAYRDGGRTDLADAEEREAEIITSYMPEQLSDEDLLGDSVELDDDYGVWWSYVWHFVDVPGYVYAYAYGHLLALSVYRRYEEEGEAFVPAYLDLLRAGGSRAPEELGAIVGDAVAESGASSPQEMGKVMALVMPKVKGRADGKRVSAAVKEKLTP